MCSGELSRNKYIIESVLYLFMRQLFERWGGLCILSVEPWLAAWYKYRICYFLGIAHQSGVVVPTRRILSSEVVLKTGQKLQQGLGDGLADKHWTLS